MVDTIGKSDYGLYTLSNSLITLFLVDFGLSSAVSRYVAKYRAEGRQDKVDNFLGAVYKLYLIIDAVIFVALVIIYFCIDSIYVKLTPAELEKFKVVYLISASFAVINFPFVTFNGILNSYEKFIPLKLADVIYRILLVALTVDNSYLWKGDSDFIIWRSTEGIEQSLKDNPFTYAAWAKIYRKEVIGNTRFCEEFKINEDSLFVFEVLCKQPKFIGLKDEIYGYRNNVDSASHAKFSEKYFDVVKVAKKKYKIIKELYPAFLELAENMLLKADMNMLQIIAMRTHGEYKVQEKELLKEFRKKSKYYISAKKTDDKWFFVLKNHMYWIYKIVMGMR